MDILLTARAIVASSPCALLSEAALQTGVRSLLPQIRKLEITNRLDSDVEQAVSKLTVPCGFDDTSGITLLRHRHPDTYRDVVSRLAERLKEDDKIRRSLKVYTSFFENESRPETNKEAFIRIFKTFPW